MRNVLQHRQQHGRKKIAIKVEMVVGHCNLCYFRDRDFFAYQSIILGRSLHPRGVILP